MIAMWQNTIMKLETYLTEQGIKPTAFAAEIGVAPSTITRLLRGERSPRLELMVAIKKATGGAVTIDDFMAGETA
jgi:plasmid maintenance system antidote protein VapI